MADFQSSLLATEIESVLTGAVVFNQSTKLTESQKAQARANIGATALGNGIAIISHFDTQEELEAAITDPKAGDAYSVGSSVPYNLYIYDHLRGDWVDYGPIRSTDISARFAQNISVGVDAWEEDTTVFADYIFKAAIPLAEVTGADFPIVAFSPSDAVGGNYCPIAFCFDGYVEIWARAIPAEGITIPAITFIVQDDIQGATGTNTKGITNAGGGIATGGVGTAQLANGSVTSEKIAAGAVSQTFTATIPTDGWTAYQNYYVYTTTINGLLASDAPIVDLNLSGKNGEELVSLTEAWGNVLRAGVNSSGQFYIYFSEAPTVDIPIKIMVVRK